MDLTSFMPPPKKNPARAATASPRGETPRGETPSRDADALRGGLTLVPLPGWEGCASPITVQEGRQRQIGRAELHAQGTVGISKLHCTVAAQVHSPQPC